MLNQVYRPLFLHDKDTLFKYVLTESFQINVRRMATIHTELSGGLIYGDTRSEIMLTVVNGVIPDTRHSFVDSVENRHGRSLSIDDYKESLVAEGEEPIGVWVHTSGMKNNETFIISDLIDYSLPEIKTLDEILLVAVDVNHPMKPLVIFRGLNNNFRKLVLS